MAPPNGNPSPARPASGHRRVVPAIPLQYPRSQQRRRSDTKSLSQDIPTPAKSEKSDTTSGDERHTIHGVTLQHPMTPESLASSLHKTDGSVSATQEEGVAVSEKEHDSAGHTNGSADYAVSMPPLPAHLTFQTTPAPEEHAANGTARTNGLSHADYGSNKEDKAVKPPVNSFKPLKIPQELPPEFHPSEPSSTPLSSDSSAMRQPHFQPYAAAAQHNHFYAHAPQMPPRPIAFNPEANFQPLDRRGTELSRTPSHTSSVDRPLNGFGIQSPMVPRTPATFNDPKMASAFSLQDYILAQFDQPALSDSIIDISALVEGSERRQIQSHTLVLFRSGTLRQMMQKLEEPDRVISIQPQNKFMSEFGFMAALRYLYGAPLFTPADFVHEMSQATFLDISSNAPAAHTMSKILSYVASGYYLDLPTVIGAGLDCARHLQRWDTVPTSLAFALDGGLSQWMRSIADPEEKVDGPVTSHQEPTFGEAGSQLLQDTLMFIAVSFPAGFQFDSKATQLTELPRLPTIIENRPSTSDPRLSLIRFGNMAIEDTGRPDFVTTFLSSILLSLPFAPLKFLFEHPMFNPKVTNRSSIAQAVINERESRRTKVLQAKRLKDGADPTLWEATKWSEHVEETAHVFPGFHLYRVRAGTDSAAGA